MEYSSILWYGMGVCDHCESVLVLLVLCRFAFPHQEMHGWFRMISPEGGQGQTKWKRQAACLCQPLKLVGIFKAVSFPDPIWCKYGVQECDCMWGSWKRLIGSWQVEWGTGLTPPFQWISFKFAWPFSKDYLFLSLTMNIII